MWLLLLFSVVLNAVYYYITRNTPKYYVYLQMQTTMSCQFFLISPSWKQIRFDYFFEA